MDTYVTISGLFAPFCAVALISKISFSFYSMRTYILYYLVHSAITYNYIYSQTSFSGLNTCNFRRLLAQIHQLHRIFHLDIGRWPKSIGLFVLIFAGSKQCSPKMMDNSHLFSRSFKIKGLI